MLLLLCTITAPKHVQRGLPVVVQIYNYYGQEREVFFYETKIKVDESNLKQSPIVHMITTMAEVDDYALDPLFCNIGSNVYTFVVLNEYDYFILFCPNENSQIVYYQISVANE